MFNGQNIEWNETCKHMAFYLIGMNIVTLNQRKHEHLSTYVGFAPYSFFFFLQIQTTNKWDLKIRPTAFLNTE